MHTRLCTIALCTAATALAAGPAWAQDADAFGQRFVELMATSGIELSYESATAEGDTIVLSNFSVAPVGEDPVELPGDLTFTGVGEGDDGSFTAETATIEDIDFSPEVDEGEPEISIAMANFLIEDILMPAEYEIGDLSGLLLYRHASVGPVTVTANGMDVFSIESLVADTEADDALTELTSSYALTGMMIDLERIVDFADSEEEVAQAEEARVVFEAFDIQQLSADFSGAGTWMPESGDAEISELRFDFTDLGSLVMSASVTGYTAELYGEMMKTQQKAMDAQGEMDDAEAAALEQAMMGMFEGIGINSATVRYEDASLFGKVLSFAAAEQGVDAATLSSGLQFMVPMMLAEMGNQALSAMVTGAVNSFVGDPQSFTVSVAPESTVYMPELIAAGESDPFALIDLLGLTVSAND